MPKSTLKTSKKKKYNARFPPARIKKIMQMDEDVGKVAAAVPVIISRALEMFIESLVTKTSKVTHAKNAKTLSTSHIKQTIKSTKQFECLRELVKDVPDHQTEDNGESGLDAELSVRKSKGGRPKRIDGSNTGRKRKSGGNRSSSDEEEEEDEDDDEDTETDEEFADAGVSSVPAGAMPMSSRSNIQTLQAPSSSSHRQQLQQHHPSPLPSSLSTTMNHNNNNNNNNYIPPLDGSTSVQSFSTVRRDAMISGETIAPVLPQQSLPLSLNSAPLLHSNIQIKQPLYQMSSNFDMPISSFSPQLSSVKGTFYNNAGLPVNSSAYIQSPVSQKLSQQQQQQLLLQPQPIDLSKPLLQQPFEKEEDDYDA